MTPVLRWLSNPRIGIPAVLLGVWALAKVQAKRRDGAFFGSREGWADFGLEMVAAVAGGYIGAVLFAQQAPVPATPEGLRALAGTPSAMIGRP